MLDQQRVKNILESLFFVTKKPLSIEELKELIECEENILIETINALVEEYKDKGIKLLSMGGGYIFATPPENAEYIRNLVEVKVEAILSPQSLETLAIIAYKQALTQSEIEKIRGVNCEGVIATLIARGMIEEKGRKRTVGRPIIYGTTEEFLRHFGLKDLNDLPPLPERLEEQEEIFKKALHE